MTEGQTPDIRENGYTRIPVEIHGNTETKRLLRLKYSAWRDISESFIICNIADNFFPQVGESVVKILRKSGVELDFPKDQTCCGQPAFNAVFCSPGPISSPAWIWAA